MGNIGIYLITSVFFIFTWIYFTKNNKNIKLINQFPGPKVYPIIGTIWPILFMKKYEIFRYIRSLSKVYGPVYRTWIGTIPGIQITAPEYVEVILSSSVHITKGFIYKYILPWLGDGLLTSKGEKWHRHRKLLTPTFHFKILETFMDVFVNKSEMLVKILAKEVNGKSFNIFPYITRCTLDIISETAMGIQVNAMSKASNKYVDAIHGACEEVIYRFPRFWLAFDCIYYKTKRGKKFLQHLTVLHDTTNSVINDRMKILEKQNSEKSYEAEDNFGKKKRKAFLDLLLEVSKGGTVLTHEQIREEVDTFLFEGHDTTTASISWTIFLLGLHPDIQKKTYEEVSFVLKDDKRLSFEDLNELKYLERVIKESLRLYPSVATISRIASEDIKIDNYIIPGGTSISLHIYDVHRNEKHFPEPDKFDPDRFLPEITKNRHPYAYIPFSAGPRNCIGQKFALYEEKTILSYILKNFRIVSTQTIDEVHPVSDLIVRPDNGINIILEKR